MRICSYKSFAYRGLPKIAALALASLVGSATAIANEEVTVTRLAEGALQPKAVVDHNGNLHLVFLRGEASACDVYYSFRPADASEFSLTTRANSLAGSGLATGVVRGPDIAVDRQGNVHLAWIGSKQAQPRPADDSSPILYARLAAGEQTFEEQRNVVTWATGVDGGATIVVDAENRIAIMWHAGPGHADESARSVYTTISGDKGKTWPREERILNDELGACSCCDLTGRFTSEGELQFLYRSATDSKFRSVYLGGTKRRPELLQEWELNSCPMSTFAVAPMDNVRFVAAWDRDGELFVTAHSPNERLTWQPSGDGINRKHPAIAVSQKGEILIVWTEGTAWAKGGQLCWQLFDKNGTPVSEVARAEDLPVWGTATTVFMPKTGFEVLY